MAPSDVTGVEIAGALKNVLAIAAGIVDGMHLGNNSMAALVAQGCSEIRWLATKVLFTNHFSNADFCAFVLFVMLNSSNSRNLKIIN